MQAQGFVYIDTVVQVQNQGLFNASVWGEVIFLNTASFICALYISVFCCSWHYLFGSNITRCNSRSAQPGPLGYVFHNIQQTRASKCLFQDKYSHKVIRILTVCFVLLLVLGRLCHMFSFKNSQSTEITLHIIQLMFLKVYHTLSLVSRSFLWSAASRFICF